MLYYSGALRQRLARGRSARSTGSVFPGPSLWVCLFGCLSGSVFLGLSSWVCLLGFVFPGLSFWVCGFRVGLCIQFVALGLRRAIPHATAQSRSRHRLSCNMICCKTPSCVAILDCACEAGRHAALCCASLDCATLRQTVPEMLDDACNVKPYREHALY